ncbi:hypothetical protein [Sphingomonas sp. DC2300-3]|uniref:hypothetical protein n=1 Tax=unclassified Sphingomonas TaxID=196159 RepID=UPI003CE8A74E
MSDQWPDPSEWITELQHHLKGLDAVFLTYEGIRTKRLSVTQDDLDKLGIQDERVQPEVTHQYARALSRVVEALEQLPPFATGEGLAALRALRLDLVSLDGGGTPDRLRPRPSTSKGGNNEGQRVAKAHMVAYVRLLEELGFSNAKAREHVAATFKRENLDVSASTLFRWAAEVCGAGPDDPHAPARRQVELMLAEWKSDPSWPFSSSEADQLIRRAAAGTTISLAHTT